MELLLYGRYIIMIFSPLSSQFRINFCKNLQKIYCINSVLYSKCLPCTKNAISWLTSGPQKSFTTLFSPDRHRKKAQYSFYHKNLEKGNKITNNEGYRFFGTPCSFGFVPEGVRYGMCPNILWEDRKFIIESVPTSPLGIMFPLSLLWKVSHKPSRTSLQQ